MVLYPSELKILAPAKINLFLHITGKRSDGYHLLDTLVVFADFGDMLKFEPADRFMFEVSGPFAKDLTEGERDPSPMSRNLVVRAAYKLARAMDRPLNMKITLDKELPIAAGLGGGSADAAACLRALCKWWDLPLRSSLLNDFMLDIGSDVPVCFKSMPSQVQGVGDILLPLPNLPALPVVLVNPGVSCPTWEIFKSYVGPQRNPCQIPNLLIDRQDFLIFLQGKVNDLFPYAKKQVPQIAEILDVLKHQKGISTSGMSGSGATCYGLFKTEADAHKAAKTIKSFSSEWWVRTGWINRQTKYVYAMS